MEERKSWEQMEGENDLWYGRFVKFMRLGSKRSINAVFKKENNNKQQQTTMFPGPTWYDAAKTWKWEERARSYDEDVRAEEDRIIAEERDKVLRSGFALMHKRVQELDKLSRKLIRMTNDEGKIWIPETRTITSGEDSTQIVEKVVFNAPLFLLIEKYFAGIAAEMGERVKKQEITGKDGTPLVGRVGFFNPEDNEAVQLPRKLSMEEAVQRGSKSGNS